MSQALEGKAMIPGMAWELDAESRRIALEEGIRNRQASREAMAALAAQRHDQSPHRSWLLRAAARAAAWMNTSTTPRRTTSSSMR